MGPEFLEFAIENISELFGYLATGRVNIRICRDIEGEMWFGVGIKHELLFPKLTTNNKGILALY